MTEHVLEGTGIHYSLSGNPSRETIVFLHPAFTSKEAFSTLSDLLREDYQLIALDLPGHGRSQGHDVEGGLEKTSSHVKSILTLHGCSEAHLVGVSVGALIAQDFANRFPDSTKSLCAVGGYDINNYDHRVAAAQRGQQMRFLIQAFVSIPWFARTNARISTWTPQAAEEFEAMNRTFTRRSLRHFQSLSSIMNQQATGNRPYPLALVVGEHDTPLARELSHDWHQREKESTFTVIANAGHCAQMDAPAALYQFLSRFLKEGTPHDQSNP